MLSQTSEKHDLVDLVCDACCLWLASTYMFVLWLGMLWMWCLVPVIILDVNIESGCLRWSPWEALSNGFRLWILLTLIGLCMELIFSVGWLCLRMIRDQQLEGAHYTLLSMRVYRAISTVFFGTAYAYMSLLDAVLPCPNPRQEREDLHEKQDCLGEKPQEVETV
ncbi:hypothetical protein F5B17DRAFT_193056 [Nemania serpens]|nr:hypothetical protein F5B17DRAFT_193056 [Nemania serpens]